MNSVVVHYKELALKGKNRPWFVQILVRNLRRALTGLGVSTIRSVMGRIEIEFEQELDWAAISGRVSDVFGVEDGGGTGCPGCSGMLRAVHHARASATP